MPLEGLKVAAKPYFKRFLMYLDQYFEPVKKGEPNWAEKSEQRNVILDNVRRLNPLSLTINEVLRRAKIVTSPPLTQVEWCLSAAPRPTVTHKTPSIIQVDLPCDPIELEHLSIDRIGFGQKGLDFVEQVLVKIEASRELRTFFPFEVIREACALFEQRGYILIRLLKR